METKYHILFKFATRSRPEKFFKGLDNIITNLNNHLNYTILVTADTDDKSMYNASVLERLKPYLINHKVKIIFGTSKSKIDAINRDMDKAPSFDILVNFSDDMEFLVKGFDDVIRRHFSDYFPDTDGNIYFNDGFVGDKISTLSIIGKKYYDRFNYIYHPEYLSLFCDDEYTLVAKKLNKIHYFNINLYRHNHPANGIGVADEQLKKTESLWDKDKFTFLKRREMNFDLPLNV